MNQGKILTPVAKGYNSKDFFAADVISEKVRAGATSVGVVARHYSTNATAFVKRNPLKVLLITTGVAILVTTYINRSEVANQFRKWTYFFKVNRL